MMPLVRSFTVTTSLLIALVLMWAPEPAHGQPPVDRVRQLLSGYEHVPGRETLGALGPDTERVLMALARDPGERGYVRLRAVGALAHFPTDRAQAFLLGVARDGELDPLFVREAVLALGRGFGKRAVAQVAPFLRHDDPAVRRAAARALAMAGTPRAREHMRKHLAHEPSPSIRRAIERWLAQPPR